MVYELQEINYIIWQDILKIQEYLKKSNLKYEPKEFIYNSHGSKRTVTFKRIDYFTCAKQPINITEPFAYFTFEATNIKNMNNFKHVKSYKAFDWVFMNEKPARSLRSNFEIAITEQTQMVIIAYMKKEFIE